MTRSEHQTRDRPSISDVALAAGVSRAAVSKVIRNAYGVSPAMRTRVEAAIEELNYRPLVAARVMRGASFTIGFEVPHMGNDLFTQVVAGASRSLAESKYQLMITPTTDRLGAASVLDAFVDRQMDGIITVSYDVSADLLERVAEFVPIVVLGRHDPSQAYDTVTGDDVAGTDLVMDHLFELGHRRIAHITIRPTSDRTPQAVRATTYSRRMEEAGLAPHLLYGGESESDAYVEARTLLEGDEPPTAIFAAYDTLAIGVLRAVADLGLRRRRVGGRLRRHRHRAAPLHLLDHNRPVRHQDGRSGDRTAPGADPGRQDEPGAPSGRTTAAGPWLKPTRPVVTARRTGA